MSSSYTVTLLGKYLCFALLALAVDLICWGYFLSLGMGFLRWVAMRWACTLMRQIGERGVGKLPELPDFMVFLNWQELPWYWHGFDMFWFAIGHGGCCTGVALSFVRLSGIPVGV